MLPSVFLIDQRGVINVVRRNFFRNGCAFDDSYHVRQNHGEICCWKMLEVGEVAIEFATLFRHYCYNQERFVIRTLCVLCDVELQAVVLQMAASH